MQEKTDAKLKDMNAGQEHVKEDIKASEVALKEEMRAWRKVMKSRRETMMEACLEKTKITDLDTNSEETVRVGTLEDQRGDWHVAVGHRRQPKKWTQGDGGSRKKLAEG
jgi:hypothetical protein